MDADFPQKLGASFIWVARALGNTRLNSALMTRGPRRFTDYVIEANDLTKVYKSERKTVLAVDHLNLTVERGIAHG